MTKALLPDPNSWLVEPLLEFFKLVKNEFYLSLFEALNEYVEYHANCCGYLGFYDLHSLSLYCQLDYDSQVRMAKLKKIFFLSEKAKFILTWNYGNVYNKDHNKHQTNIPLEFEGNCPGLDFFSSYNNLDIYQAKEMLFKYSFHRESLKKLIIIENELEHFDEDSLSRAVITYDLSFLKECNFFKVQRYATFEKLLPKNLIIELPINVDSKIKKIPQQLRDEQLIKINRLNK